MRAANTSMSSPYATLKRRTLLGLIRQQFLKCNGVKLMRRKPVQLPLKFLRLYNIGRPIRIGRPPIANMVIHQDWHRQVRVICPWRVICDD